MSKRTNFHATEELLIERARLHGLVDIFWEVLPHTRDEIYKEMSTLLCTDDAHISDLDSEQITKVAEYFHKKIADIAPCHRCQYAHKTSYGVWMCDHPEGHGAYWHLPESRLAARCKLYVQGHIPTKE